MINPFETPKYPEKFGLKEPPYTTNPDERYLFLTDTHQNAISMCGRLIQNREGAGLIVGDHGTGKTTIMRRLTSLMRTDARFRIAVIETAEHCPSLFQLVKEILESFGEECVGRDTKTRVDQLKQFLFARFKEQQACVLFIDEAQQMKGSLLESLRGLLNFEDPAAGGKLLQIILLAMPGINRKLRFAPSFSNRVVRTQLGRMTRNEKADMLEWRFIQAGGRIFVACLDECSASLAVLARGCYRPIDDLSRLWKTRWLAASPCHQSVFPGEFQKRTIHNKKNPQQIAESSSQSLSLAFWGY